MDRFTKWVACWGNATSITDRTAATYAKDITLRYPIRMPLDGSAVRLRFSNLTGTEPVRLTRVVVALQGEDYHPAELRFAGDTSQTGNTSATSVIILPGEEVESEALAVNVKHGMMLDVSIYLGEYTQMNAGTLITGPLSRGQYSYGDHADEAKMPQDLTRNTNWFYFLNTIDILTEAHCRAVVCYGDSITAQSWPDYLSLRLEREGRHDVAIIRRAVSGTRILRQYECITYQAYGLKGATRFPIEMNVSGASDVIIQHGINDIIHPVGVEVNPFRPWSDMPTVEEMEQGIEQIYVEHARALGLRVWSGTLLPIEGWRTYNEERDRMRGELNEWLRTAPIFDGCIDFDKAVCDPQHPAAFAPGFDSGDHLHPSEAAYQAMAEAVMPEVLGL